LDLPVETQGLPATLDSKEDPSAKADDKPIAVDRESLGPGLKGWFVRPPAMPPAAVVICFTGPSGPTPEQVSQQWQSAVRQAGVLLAGFEGVPRQIEAVAAAALWAHLSKSKLLDPQRTFVHGAGEGCASAVAFVRGRRAEIRGLVLAGVADVALEPMQPESALAFFWLVSQNQAASAAFREGKERLQAGGYPMLEGRLPEDVAYLQPEHTLQISAWIRWVTAL
jgi:hypothetical protein